MWEDPIVAEVHRIREALASRFNYDIHAMFADMRKRQAGIGSRLVSLAKPTKPTAETDHYTGSSGAASSEAAPAGLAKSFGGGGRATPMVTDDIARTHRHSIRHRDEALAYVPQDLIQKILTAIVVPGGNHRVENER